MARWRNKPGAWRNMLLTQPPALGVYAEYCTGDWEASRNGYGGETTTLTSASGVTVGQLVEYAEKVETQGKKVNWDRCWFQVWGRVCWSDREAAEAEALSTQNQIDSAEAGSEASSDSEDS